MMLSNQRRPIPAYRAKKTRIGTFGLQARSDEFTGPIRTWESAADVAVLPYRHICQSGFLFLAHSFGLRVITADVGSVNDEIRRGHDGVCIHPRRFN